MRIYHTVYKTVNLVNGKIYIGVHETKNPYDDYLGSGIALANAIAKYGRESFKKYILLCAMSKVDSYELESQLIAEYCTKKNSYNISPGGNGGHTGNYDNHKGNKWAVGTEWTDEMRECRRQLMLGNTWSAGIVQSEITRKRRSASSKGHKKPESWHIARSARVGKAAGARRFIVLSPDGVEYEVYGLKRFCEENGLSEFKMRNSIDKGKIPPLSAAVRRVAETSTNTIGWEIKSGD